MLENGRALGAIVAAVLWAAGCSPPPSATPTVPVPDAAPVADAVSPPVGSPDADPSDAPVDAPATASLSVRVIAADARSARTSVRLDDGARAQERSTWGDHVDFDAVTPGRHRVSVSRRGSPPASVDVTLADGERAAVDVRIEPGAAIDGRVIDDAGVPIGGVVVMAALVGGPRTPRGTPLEWSVPADTDADGRYRIDGLESVPHELFVFGGRVPVLVDTDRLAIRPIATPPTSGVAIVASRTCRATLRMSLPQSAPCPTVSQSRESSAWPSIVTSDDTEVTVAEDVWRLNGTLQMSIAPRASWLRVCVPGFAPVFVNVTAVELGRVVDLGTRAAESGITLEGRTVDSDGEPLPGVNVSVLCGHPTARTVQSDAEGRFVVDHLPPGRVCLRAELGRFYGDVLLREPGEGRVMLVARRMGVLTGVVLQADGSAAADASVIVWNGDVSRTEADEPARKTRTKTGADGCFSVEVAAGTCRAVAYDGRSTRPFHCTVEEGGRAWVRVELPRPDDAK